MVDGKYLDYVKNLLSDFGGQIFCFFLGRAQYFPQPSTEVNIISFDYKYQNTKRIIKCDRNKYDNNLGKNMYLKGYKYRSKK